MSQGRRYNVCECKQNNPFYLTLNEYVRFYCPIIQAETIKHDSPPRNEMTKVNV